eukprot:Pgem_evm1s13639
MTKNLLGKKAKVKLGDIIHHCIKIAYPIHRSLSTLCMNVLQDLKWTHGWGPS